MQSFLHRFGALALGVLCGFDRLFFRGTLRNLAYAQGLQNYLWANRIPFKDFHEHSQQVTQALIEASLRHAQECGREIRYLNSNDQRKEDVARDIARRDQIRDGLICVLRSVDPCLSFSIHRNRERRRLEITYRQRKCLHLYHYFMHRQFGFMHARIQTWFPFRIYVCLNGRHWLARQMDQAGLRYQQRDNCFTWLEDIAQAQELFDQQLQTAWPTVLGELAQVLNPVHQQIFAHYPSAYYWSVAQSEWASDVMFRSRAELQPLYRRLIRHAITTYDSTDVLRFLGRRLRSNFNGEVMSSCKHREEGIRIKHWLNFNSIKLYDKDSVLRPETTIVDPEDFRVYRPKEGDPEGEKAWRPLRYGVADLHRRAQVSQAANDRYLGALAAIADTTPLKELAAPLCQPTTYPRQASGAPQPKARSRRVRALNPLAAEDAALLEAVVRPEFVINGLRNRDLRPLLFSEPADDRQRRRQSAAVTRKLRMLRAHGLIHKVPKTHRYQVSAQGRTAILALLAARDANADLLTTSAA